MFKETKRDREVFKLNVVQERQDGRFRGSAREARANGHV